MPLTLAEMEAIITGMQATIAALQARLVEVEDDQRDTDRMARDTCADYQALIEFSDEQGEVSPVAFAQHRKWRNERGLRADKEFCKRNGIPRSARRSDAEEEEIQEEMAAERERVMTPEEKKALKEKHKAKREEARQAARTKRKEERKEERKAERKARQAAKKEEVTP